MKTQNLIHEAVSLSPNIVTFTVNKDGRLERKVHQVWIDDKQDFFFVFRESTSAPGQFSNDIYSLSTLKFLREDGNKYSLLPTFPTGAIEHVVVTGITCSAMARLDHTYLLNLATSLNLLPKESI